MKKYYEAYEDRYKKIHKETGMAWAGERPSPTIEELLKKYNADSRSTILEIGCGEGQNAINLIEKGYDVIASDISSEAIRWAKVQAEKRNIDKKNFFVMDALNNNLEEKFDFIYTVATLHMLVEDTDRLKFLQFIYNHLKPDGKAFIIIMGDGISQKKTDTSKAFDLSDRQFGDKTVKVATTSCRIVNWEELFKELTNANLKVLNHFIDTEISGFSTSMVSIVERNDWKIINE